MAKKSQISGTILAKKSDVWMKMAITPKSEGLYGTRKLFWLKMSNIPDDFGNLLEEQ
ncbi:hypothetical protein Hanom_Chr04g00314151 [Helianthus anomalus]